MNYEKWLSLNASSLQGKTAIITGATGGLGKEIVFTLAKLNCNMIFLDRNLTKSIKLKNEILKIYPNIDIKNIHLDLLNFQQVKQVVEYLKTINFNILIHNAAVYNVPLFKTSTDYNNVFQTNFVSPYYITKQLLPTLKKSENPKVIAVSSIAHSYTKLNSNDIDFSLSKKHSHIYGNSKRFLTFSLFELFKNESKVELSICHPGITLTNITNHYPKAINWLVKFGVKLIFPKPKTASLNIVKGVFSKTEYRTWIGPKIFNIWGKPNKKKLKICIEESEKMFEIAENIYKQIKD